MRRTWQQQLVQAYFYFYQVCLIFHFVFVPDSCLPALVETAKKKKNIVIKTSQKQRQEDQ